MTNAEKLALKYAGMATNAFNGFIAGHAAAESRSKVLIDALEILSSNDFIQGEYTGAGRFHGLYDYVIAEIALNEYRGEK